MLAIRTIIFDSKIVNNKPLPSSHTTLLPVPSRFSHLPTASLPGRTWHCMQKRGEIFLKNRKLLKSQLVKSSLFPSPNRDIYTHIHWFAFSDHNLCGPGLVAPPSMWRRGGLAHAVLRALLDLVLPMPRQEDKESLCSSQPPSHQDPFNGAPPTSTPRDMASSYFLFPWPPARLPTICPFSTTRLGGGWALCSIASGSTGTLGANPHIST